MALILCAASSLAGSEPPASSAACGPPKLTIVSPTSGETVRAPTPVRFRVTCFRLGSAPYGHIHAWIRPPRTSRRLELRPRRQAGVVEIADPLLSGQRTLIFQLARANHRPLRNPEARVVVRDVLFEGP